MKIIRPSSDHPGWYADVMFDSSDNRSDRNDAIRWAWDQFGHNLRDPTEKRVSLIVGRKLGIFFKHAADFTEFFLVWGHLLK